MNTYWLVAKERGLVVKRRCAEVCGIVVKADRV